MTDKPCKHSAQDWVGKPNGLWCEECDAYIKRRDNGLWYPVLDEGPSIAYQETKGRVLSTLDNCSYGKGDDALKGALEAILKWSSKRPSEIVALLWDMAEDVNTLKALEKARKEVGT